jgi:hypothetical protein
MTRRRHHRRGHSSLKKRYGRAGRGDVVDADAVSELDLYAENTSELYGQKKAILANIARKLKSGKYDHTKAPKLWGYWVDAAAKRYTKEFGGPGDNISVLFNKATRDALAKELADRYRSGEE